LIGLSWCDDPKGAELKKKLKLFDYLIAWPICFLGLSYFFYLTGMDYIYKVFLPLLILGAFIAFILSYTRHRRYAKAYKNMEAKYKGQLEDYISLGYAAYNAHNFSKAETIFKDIIARYPEDPAGYCGIAILEFEKNNFVDAKLNFEKVIDLDQNNDYEIARKKLNEIEGH
jgi:tetratricopeptide (TPR) repeat protein